MSTNVVVKVDGFEVEFYAGELGTEITIRTPENECFKVDRTLNSESSFDIGEMLQNYFTHRQLLMILVGYATANKVEEF